MAYMWDFTGREEASGETMIAALKTRDFKDAVAKHGTLPQMIGSWADGQGLVVTDRSVGTGGWQLGIPFQALAAAVTVFTQAEVVFGEALKRKWMTMSLSNGWSEVSEKDLGQYR